jgi:excisionase family DNA binding protein
LTEYLDLEGSAVLETRVPDSTMSLSTIMADKDDILLNSREVAFLLDLSPDTVNEFARRNILPAFKKGRQWRFRKRDIALFKRHLRGVNAAA